MAFNDIITWNDDNIPRLSRARARALISRLSPEIGTIGVVIIQLRKWQSLFKRTNAPLFTSVYGLRLFTYVHR